MRNFTWAETYCPPPSDPGICWSDTSSGPMHHVFLFLLAGFVFAFAMALALRKSADSLNGGEKFKSREISITRLTVTVALGVVSIACLITGMTLMIIQTIGS
jgi:hypothetical protein